MTEIRGVCPVISTPFDESGAVVYDDFERIVNVQSERRCQGVILFGIDAEYYKLSDDARREIVHVAADACADAETSP